MKPDRIKVKHLVPIPVKSSAITCCTEDHDGFTIDETGLTWTVSHCGGCTTLCGITFCPFCGAKLPTADYKEEYRLELPPLSLEGHTLVECAAPSNDGDGYCRSCQNPLLLHPGYFGG